jgi:hypothetical protein
MKWTKRHSENAVAAKARRHMADPEATPPPEPRRYVPRPRGRAKWRLQLRDLEHGDSLTLTLHRLPWPARYVDTAGRAYSAADLGRMVARLLTAAP